MGTDYTIHNITRSVKLDPYYKIYFSLCPKIRIIDYFLYCHCPTFPSWNIVRQHHIVTVFVISDLTTLIKVVEFISLKKQRC